MKNIKAFLQTDVGMVRETNQDSAIIDKFLGIYLVADGMGGKAGGEVASSLAVEAIKNEIEKMIDNLCYKDVLTRKRMLAQIINMASLKIYERSLELPQYRGMGTTATLLWISPKDDEKYTNTAIISHVGDSRCYLLRSAFLYQITDDHSLVNEQIKLGILSPNDALRSQIKNVITRCVGYQEEEDVDSFTIDLVKGDRFLLCSDGLTNKVSDEEIRTYLCTEEPDFIAKNLVDLANKNGGDDNITVLIVEI